jgi:ankyrin repeat protein
MAITPDAKDWTWVIEAECPECRFDARTVACTEVAAGLRDNAVRWQQVLAGSDVATRPNPDRWSPLEYACHVRDVCLLYRQRLDRMLTEADPMYENWDQDQTAIELRYDEQQPAIVAVELDAAAAAMATQLETVDGQAWQRPGRRSDGASFTVDTLSRYFLHDLVHHLWDVQQVG